MPRIYLDNAATSWPKPPEVYAAVEQTMREVGAAAGRGAYDSAAQAGRIVAATRSAVAKFIGAENPSRIIFTAGGTEALNLAIQGLVQPGDHVVTTVCEHNSVLRPLAMLRDSLAVKVDYAPCGPDGVVSPTAIEKLLQPETKLVAMLSASNVTGALQPIAAVGQLCHGRRIAFLVDAAQSLGHEPLDVRTSHISLLAAPGHKGLLGPLGVGLLYVAPGWEDELRPLLLGGTGINSDEETPPKELPARYEAGNLNVPALAGLAAGLGWLANHDDSPQHATRSLMEGLIELPGVTLYGPPCDEPRAPVVSFTLDGYDPQEVAAVLASAQIECRAGLHCAPRMHQALGVADCGGTIRLSPGHETTDAENTQTIQLLEQLAQSR